MNWADVINGSLELIGGLFILLSIRKLYQDKQVRGVSWVHVLFFAFWGFWNLFYYPHLGQWVSFFGTIVIVTTNTIWVGMLFYYSWLERKRAERDATVERLKHFTSRRSS